MEKSFNSISFVASVVCFLSLFVSVHGAAGSHFSVQGQVYCDTCHAQFVTRVSEYMNGATVRLECREVEGGKVIFKQEAVTDPSGTYHIKVDGDYEDDLCEVVLVKSPIPDCAGIPNDEHLRTAAEVSLTNNNGVVSTTRMANPLGFLKKERLPVCTEVLKELGITPQGIIP